MQQQGFDIYKLQQEVRTRWLGLKKFFRYCRIMSGSRLHTSLRISHRVVRGFSTTEKYSGSSRMMDTNDKRRKMERPVMKPMSV